MTNLQEVQTDDLLSFQDYPTVHNSNDTSVLFSDSQMSVKDKATFEIPSTLQAMPVEMNNSGISFIYLLYL